jgi:hypothetical protein
MPAIACKSQPGLFMKVFIVGFDRINSPQIGSVIKMWQLWHSITP